MQPTPSVLAQLARIEAKLDRLLAAVTPVAHNGTAELRLWGKTSLAERDWAFTEYLKGESSYTQLSRALHLQPRQTAMRRYVHRRAEREGRSMEYRRAANKPSR